MMISNLNVYLAIAEEALAEAERLEAQERTPKPNDEPGFIIKYDPDRKSFKNSLIAITFSGIYLDALLYVVGVARLGKSEYLKIERNHYEPKLQLLGLSDPHLLASCKKFRVARNDLVHEKATDISAMSVGETHVAQTEAINAVSFVKAVAELLRKAP